MPVVKKLSLTLLIIGYMAAGINHFRVPDFYIGIIPQYLPFPHILNTLAGAFEITFGLLLAFKPTRKIAAWGIILMLIAFLPVHIGMLGGHTRVNGKSVTPLLAWARLFLQPFLIAWAGWHTRGEIHS
jgi:uncharacterized membrane protein